MKEYLGVDVGKKNLDISSDRKVDSIPNTPKAIQAYFEKFQKKKKVYLVVCEATGGYEQTLTNQLQKLDIPVLVEHPNKIRAFAKSKGLFAKTDQMDAKLIFEYARTMKVNPKQQYLSQEIEGVRALLKRREQLINTKTQETLRLDPCVSETIKQSIAKHIQFLEKQIESINQEIEALAKQSEIQKKVQLLTSIPAIGQQTALMILAYLPEVGYLKSKSLAALVGVAPFNRDSGKFHGKRFVLGGRKTIRKALYMSAISAIRCNKTIKAFYTRLRSKGKPPKLCLIAVMNKMIAIINSVYKRSAPWVESLTAFA